MIEGDKTTIINVNPSSGVKQNKKGNGLVNSCKEHCGSVMHGVFVVPLQVSAVLLLTFSKLLVEVMATSFMVPHDVNLWLSQIDQGKNSTVCEAQHSKKEFQWLQLALFLIMTIVPSIIVLLRRTKPTIDLVKCNGAIKEKYNEAKKTMHHFNPAQRNLALSLVFVLSALNFICLFISALQCQREFVQAHPDTLRIKEWGGNIFVQAFMAACLVITSGIVNIFEAFNNAGVLFDNYRVLMNKKAIIVLINSLTHAFTMRMFVVRFASDYKVSNAASIAMQSLFVTGAVGFSGLTTGVSLVMKKQDRLQKEYHFKGKHIIQATLYLYGVLFSLFQQNLGINVLLYDAALGSFTNKQQGDCYTAVKTPTRQVLFVVSLCQSTLSVYSYIKYIQPQVYKGFDDTIKFFGSSCCRKKRSKEMNAVTDALISDGGEEGLGYGSIN